jgi:hypothetical protein
MRKFIIMVGFGFGLALGGGLFYLLTTNVIALIVFFGMAMFVMGCLVVGAALLVQNRMWTKAVFGDGGQQPARVNYNLRMPAPTLAGYPYQPPQGLLPAAQQWPNPPQMDYEFPPLQQSLPTGDEPEAIA